MEHKFSMPFHVGWDVLYKCNLRCKHCFLTSNRLADSTFIPKEEAIRFVRHLIKKKVFHLSISGGEPLLYPHLISVIREAVKGKLTVSLATNATLLNSSIAYKLRKSGLDSLQVSLDGATSGVNDATRGEGTYEKILKGIKIAVKHDFKVLIATLILKTNIHKIGQIFELAVREKALGVKVQPFINEGRGRDFHSILEPSIDEASECLEALWRNKMELHDRITILLPVLPSVMGLARQSKEPFYGKNSGIGCQTCDTTIRVAPNGDVGLCGAVISPDMVVGNVTEEPLQEIWRKINNFKERSMTRQGCVKHKPVCDKFVSRILRRK